MTHYLNTMQWFGNWVPGTFYPPWAVVRDADWTMISNKGTDDRPAPQPTGDPTWVSEFGDLPTWSSGSSTVSSIAAGQRYTMTEGLWVTSYRFWVPVVDPNRTYELWSIGNPATNPAYTQVIAPMKADKIGWETFPAGTIPISPGSVFDLILVTKALTGSPSSFNADWNYVRSNAVPLTGEITHSTNGNIMRFNHTDADATDRQTSLESVNIGGTIRSQGITWEILDITQNVNDVSYTVTPTSRIPTEAEYTFIFTWEGPISLDYVYATDYYDAGHELFGTVKGYFADDGYDPGDATNLDENAYGVDLEVQEVEASADWDILSYSGVSGGTGGTPVTNAADLHFPLQVAQGNIAGHYAVGKFGRAPDVNSGVISDIWDGANATDSQDIWVAPTQARIHNIASTSTSDIATTGAGARTIRIYGLTSWSTKEVSEDINMNGTTNVATTNSYVIIHRMKVLTKGATSVNVGKITATAVTDATVTAMILAGQGQTQMAIYGWPSTQVGYVTEIYAGIRRASLGTSEAQADIRFLLNPEPDVELLNFQVKHPTMVGSRAATPFTHNFNPYSRFDGPAILKMQAEGSANNLDVSGGFSLVLVDN